jgi:ABC-type glycerol-3-phosphate transport system substrate-binding protein
MSISVLIVAVITLSACGSQATPTPETITIVETVEKIVEVEGESVTVVETVETVVTATPEPTASPYDENAPIEVWLDATRMVECEYYLEMYPEKKDLVTCSLSDRGAFANQILLFNNIGEGWPDVIFGEPRVVSLWADAAHDYAADLTPWVPQEIIDTFGDNNNQCIYDNRMICLRHDLAQMGLWYDQVVLDELGIGIPETMEEYLALAQQVAAEHPGEGYVMGSIGGAQEWIFRASQCPVQFEVDLGHIRIFDPDDPRCVRAAQMMDDLWATGTFLANPLSGEMYELFGSKVAFVDHASWYGQHVMKPNYPPEMVDAGRVGYALNPVFEEVGEPWTGAWGGSGWAMSKHTKNPQLAIEVLIFMATGPWHGTDATTFPAYPTQNVIWGETVAKDPFYGENPFPNMVTMAPMISPDVTHGRLLAASWTAFSEKVLNPMIAGDTTAVDALPAWSEEMKNLALPAGFVVVD